MDTSSGPVLMLGFPADWEIQRPPVFLAAYSIAFAAYISPSVTKMTLRFGAMHQAEEHGFIGIGMGIFELTSAGVSAAILFAFLVAVIFKPKG